MTSDRSVIGPVGTVTSDLGDSASYAFDTNSLITGGRLLYRRNPKWVIVIGSNGIVNVGTFAIVIYSALLSAKSYP
jgi:hypothetical protein